MGNRNFKSICASYKTWATQMGHPTELPSIVSRILYLITSKKLLTVVRPIDGGERFEKERLQVVFPPSMSITCTDQFFRVVFPYITVRFCNRWYVNLDYTYVYILYRNELLYYNPRWCGMPPTHLQMLDIYSMPYREWTSERTVRASEPAKKETFVCTICYENRPTEALVPCGHTMCPSCASRLHRKQCPFCRASFTQRVHLFLHNQET